LSVSIKRRKNSEHGEDRKNQGKGRPLKATGNLGWAKKKKRKRMIGTEAGDPNGQTEHIRRGKETNGRRHRD